MKIRMLRLLLVILALVSFVRVFADGTETLGTPSIQIASGTGIAAGGVGLHSQPGVINVEVPAGATVKQVLLYWEGFMAEDAAGDDTILISNGGPQTEVTGTLIGGPTNFFAGAWASTFRADITSLGLVAAGPNALNVDGLSFTNVSNGAGACRRLLDRVRDTANDSRAHDGRRQRVYYR